MIRPGTYKGTVLSHAISQTQKGDPQAVVNFSFEADGGSHTISWYGYFTPKTTDNTIKSLITCGLKGNNPAGDLEIGKEVLLVIENEADSEGKIRAKVRWINDLSSIRNVMPQDQAKAKLAPLEGAVMHARMKLGVPDSDDIPF